MSGFSDINLDRLPAPEIVSQLDFETILADVRAYVVSLDPSLSDALRLESEPIVKILEAWAYREVLLRAEFQDAAKGNMLAFATGAQLDQLGAIYGVTRAVVVEADASVVPPVEEVLEEDARLRQRIQLSLEGFTSAGPRKSYIFWGLSASGQVKDIGVESPLPGAVQVTVLSTQGDGTADAGLLSSVNDVLSADDVRPLNDQVTVQGANIITYSVTAELTLYEGPDAELVRTAAEAAVTAFVEENHRLGHDITVSGLHSALHQAGVQNVNLIAPAGTIQVDSDEAAFCSGISVTVVGTDV